MSIERFLPVYVASRASLPERAALWRKMRDEDGFLITSSWIDEAGEGESADMGELWERIGKEIRRSSTLLLYAESDDFPLKGALVEAGIALGLGMRVIVCLPGVDVTERSCRPIGSWISHPLVTRCDDMAEAFEIATALNLREKAVTS